MCLTDAIADLKGEVLRGKTAESMVDEIVTEYGLNPKLVLRKFRESFPTDEGIRATQKSTAACTVFADKLKSEVERLCAYYRVPVGRVREAIFNGKKYTVIGALGGNKVLAVRHEDGAAYQLRLGTKTSFELR